ncbi:MAG: glycoside hydrolase family 5 protein, partial [Thermoleophilia bacterium]|nr:glycoside hydrolase family 5 protein [Thermoleophilia bacterium]
DPDHIVIFPALGDGFGFYGDPRELGLKNIAFTPHFYPGFFGWGEPTVETHTKWLTEGVQEWQRQAQAAGVPLLVGEFNPVLRAAGGAEMTARAFDTYTSLGWAATMWSYKVFSSEGGIAGGSWGMVTNPPAGPAPGSQVGLNTSSLEEIESYFASLSTMECVVYEELRDRLTGVAPQAASGQAP